MGLRQMSVFVFLGLVVIGMTARAQIGGSQVDSNDILRNILGGSKRLGFVGESGSFLCKVTDAQDLLITKCEDQSVCFSEIINGERTDNKKVYPQAKVVEQDSDVVIYSNNAQVAVIKHRLLNWYSGSISEALEFADVAERSLKCKKL